MTHSGFADAGVYDPPGVGGTHVIYVLHDTKNPELYGGLPKDPHIPGSVRLWKSPLKWLGKSGDDRRRGRHLCPLPAIRPEDC